MAVFHHHHHHHSHKPLSFVTFIIVRLFLFLLMFFASSYDALSDTEILIKFKSSLSNATALSNWEYQLPPCEGEISNWVGVLCGATSHIWGLHMENMGLSGIIDLDSLSILPNLRSLSFNNNHFGGPIPQLDKLTSLEFVYLSNNYFSGEIPSDDFTDMVSLEKLYLSQNEFTGPIPSSLVDLPNLSEIKLDGNKFSGEIPEFQQENLQIVDLSNNQLEGPIPTSLDMMDASMFAGNKGLCGPPLLTACDSPAPNANGTNSNQNNNNYSNTNSSNHEYSNSYRPSILVISIIAVVGVFILLSILALILILSRRENQLSEAKPDMRERASYYAARTGRRPRNAKVDQKEMEKLSFIREDRVQFDMTDLLKASAEILRSGCYGSSYKAVLPPAGTTVVVKRYKEMNNVGKEEFHEHIRRIGRLNHRNLLPLVAYYYKREEKLLVTDFVPRGSLAMHLHAPGTQPSVLDWPTRLKIVKGVAKGMEYLYKELPHLITPHGHLKSSNVILDKSFEPLLTDYSLIPVINLENAQEIMVAYKSPEFIQHGRIAKKTDIWALGMLILEILTGKLPTNLLHRGKGSEDDLALWVTSEIGDDASAAKAKAAVFDKEMGVGESEREEMVKLLEIGLCCCEVEVDKRLDIKECVRRIEELKGDYLLIN